MLYRTCLWPFPTASELQPGEQLQVHDWTLFGSSCWSWGLNFLNPRLLEYYEANKPICTPRVSCCRVICIHSLYSKSWYVNSSLSEGRKNSILSCCQSSLQLPRSNQAVVTVQALKHRKATWLHLEPQQLSYWTGILQMKCISSH